MRLDKWLWCARFYKTRSLAVDEIARHRVRVNGQDAKPSRELRVGDRIAMRQGAIERTLVVRGLSAQRGPAPVAQQLYEETAESLAAREQAAAQRRIAPEPAHAIAQGRPTKRERRALDGQRQGGWGERWSAALDEG